jgi:hypothetical protein
MAGVEGCEQVDLEHSAPLICVGVRDVARLNNPRAVHQNVEPAEAADRFVNHV